MTPLPPKQYDVKSARGGRGGVVASVAAYWTSVSSPPPSSPTGNSPLGKKELPQPNSGQAPPTSSVRFKPPRPSNGFTKSVLPLDTLVQIHHPTPRHAVPPPLPFLTKQNSKSLAETLLNETIAKPVLSSTASLARSSGPQAGLARRIALFDNGGYAYPPAGMPRRPLPQPGANANVIAGADIGRDGGTPVGRDRLRELISRYQGVV